MKYQIILIVISISAFFLPNSLYADITSGFQIELFANVTDPLRMTYDPAGKIYVGRSNNGSGGMRPDPVRVHQIELDGSVQEYGNSPISGPAAVLFDANGAIGPTGSLLVGGIVTSHTSLYAIESNQNVISLFGPTSSLPGPSDMAFDQNGRLVYITETGSVFTSSGQTPTELIDLPSNGRFLAIDSTNRIFTSTADGVVRIYDSNGNVLDQDFANNLGCCTSLAFGSGGAWGTDLYAMADGALLRFDSNGNSTEIGTDLTLGDSSYLLFHPDGSLYISDFTGDRILRISQIPEPTSVALLVLAGIGIAGRLRRRIE